MKKIILLCFIFIFSFSLCEGQSWEWVEQSNNDSAASCDSYSTAIDPAGNIFVTGLYLGQISFGSFHLPRSTPIGNIFLAKYDSSGNILWAKNSITPTTAHFVVPMAVACDKNYNAFITGQYFNSPIVFGNDTLKNGSGGGWIFLVKYDKNGNVLWLSNATGGISAGYSVSCDDSGYVYVTGNFEGSVGFGSIVLTSSTTSPFLAKYDSNGNVKWAVAPISAGTSYGYSVCTNHLGEVCYIGYYDNGSLQFGSTILSATGNPCYFLACYNKFGTAQWARQSILANKYSSAYGTCISSDMYNNFYVTGYYSDSVEFGTYWVTDIYDSPFILKYTATGNLTWVKTSITKLHTTYPFSISASEQGSFYLVGTFTDSLRFDAITLHSKTMDPSFLIKFDSSGHALCGTYVDNGNDDYNAVATMPSGNIVYYAGDAYNFNSDYDTCVFGTDTIKGFGEIGFLARWQPCLNSQESIPTLTDAPADITLFPNPNNGAFTIQVVSSQWSVDSKMQVEIYNVLGEKVKSEELRAESEEIDLTTQPNGIYLYRVLNEGGGLIGEGKIVVEK